MKYQKRGGVQDLQNDLEAYRNDFKKNQDFHIASPISQKILPKKSD